MTDVRKLIDRLGAEEAERLREPFVAPCARGGRVRVRIAGLVRTFVPRPRDLEGWGVFRAVDERIAERVREPEPHETAAYLGAMPSLRLWLARRLERQSWLAVPANRADARQRFSTDGPMLVRMVSGCGQFDRVVARGDGASWWFDEADRRADPATSAALRDRVGRVPPPELRLEGLTPELALAYALASGIEALPGGTLGVEALPVGDEARLRRALAMAGGRLVEFRDSGDFWWVEWRTPDGCTHQSAIAKGDLTVITAGVCLDGLDREFDLQSLVGVMQGAEEWHFE